jgi:hypothetical protein
MLNIAKQCLLQHYPAFGLSCMILLNTVLLCKPIVILERTTQGWSSRFDRWDSCICVSVIYTDPESTSSHCQARGFSWGLHVQPNYIYRPLSMTTLPVTIVVFHNFSCVNISIWCAAFVRQTFGVDTHVPPGCVRLHDWGAVRTCGVKSEYRKQINEKYGVWPVGYAYQQCCLIKVSQATSRMQVCSYLSRASSIA